jgi:type VI protein secretion system component Hcp
MEANMRANQKTDTRLVEQLSEADLENVSGGFTKVVDSSSPNLFKLCCTGKHIPTANTH